MHEESCWGQSVDYSQHPYEERNISVREEKREKSFFQWALNGGERLSVMWQEQRLWENIQLSFIQSVDTQAE